MVYLFNTNLENKKKVKIALTSIYGMGQKQASHICDLIGISEDIRMEQLTIDQVERLTHYLNQIGPLGSQLRHQKRQVLQRLVKIASYRGFRHTEGLPCRGQRTHGNARTVRRRKTIFYS